MWLYLAGRGTGKTRTAAEWIYENLDRYSSFLIAGRTAAETRDVCIQGEALALDTLIPTPSGWAQMGEIVVGDRVIGTDGEEHAVTWASPIYRGRPCYRVTFSDGSQIVADAGHKWLTETAEARRARRTRRSTTAFKPEIVTTEEIAATLTKTRWSNHGIRRSVGFSGGDRALLIDPYVLGVWLGDGTAKDSTFTSADDEIVEEVRAAGYRVVRARWSDDGRAASCYTAYGLRPKLRRLGVLNDKHVPVEYMRASRAQRLALLQGMMDTDGYVSTAGQCAFDNGNPVLTEAVRELAQSLGIQAGRVQHGIDKRKATYLGRHRIVFETRLPVFRLSRKLARLRVVERPRDEYVYIRSVEPVESVPVRCITVDSDDHLYLAGDGWVATHNSGILNSGPPHLRPIYEPSNRLLIFPGGQRALIRSGEEPDSFRGLNVQAGWLDEFAAWKKAQESWDNFVFAFRSGSHPRAIITTTPRNIPQLKAWVKEAQQKDATVAITRASTYSNLANLAPTFIRNVVRKYEGTRLGRQELGGELLEDVPGALWTIAQIEKNRITNQEDLPPMLRIVIGVDPNASSEEGAAECGIIGAGLGADGHGYVLADHSRPGTPEEWATAAINVYRQLQGDRIVGEVNNGGEMVERVLRTIEEVDATGKTVKIGKNISYKAVRASRGKVTRAEPVAALYTQGRIHHFGIYPELENQQTTWVPATGQNSPDRLDALVWAITELMIDEAGIDQWVEYAKSERERMDAEKAERMAEGARATVLPQKGRSVFDRTW